MIPKGCKRLVEVDFPIAEVSRHAVREKGIPQGHPFRMHIWWARRPLASSRAVLLTLLLPDPEDPACPEAFRDRARKALLNMDGRPRGWDNELRSNAGLRRVLIRFVGEFAGWDNGASPRYVTTAQSLVRAAYDHDSPLVVDPFAGGGSIPLESLRLGCETFASDLNPVACFILKTMLEDIPRQGAALAESIRQDGHTVTAYAQHVLADMYPDDPDGATPIAYLWARTVRCESPNCGAEIPLVRSFWLCKKASRRRALRPMVVRPRHTVPYVEFEIFEPSVDNDVPPGTVTRAKATCLCCRTVLGPERVRAQLAHNHGAADVVFDNEGRRSSGPLLLAVVTLRAGETGRRYRVAKTVDYEAVRKAQNWLTQIVTDWQKDPKGLGPVPDELTPPIGALGFRVQRYGMLRWSDLFTARQKLALITIARSISLSGNPALALALGRLADIATSGCLWHKANECPDPILKTGRVKPFWEFAEGVPTSSSSGGFEVCVEKLASGITSAIVGSVPGDVAIAAAQESPLASDAASVWFTDPPYYDAIGYADLSDFFLVWLKRALPGYPLLRDPFDPTNPLSPKRLEAVQDELQRNNGSPKDRAWFEETMARAFAEGRRVLRDDGVGSVVFAHKTTEGWEALLSGMIKGGWTITGSWPIATEMTTRLRARESAALATSVHLICRPRSDDAGVGDWASVLRALPTRVADWMERLQKEGVRGADLVFACIGPALEIYSRYSKVETPEGREVKLDEYLAKVWEVVGRSALAQVLGTAEASARNGGAGALEEDARLTGLFLWTLQATEGESAEEVADADDEDETEDAEEEEGTGKAKGYTLVFDVVRRFAQPLGIDLPKWKDRVIETKKGVVRLLPVKERAKQLFGEDGAQAVAARLEQDAALGITSLQGVLFPEMEVAPKIGGRGSRGAKVKSAEISDEHLSAMREATTLDRVHAAMLLQSAGRTNALRALLKAEQDRGPDFTRLANALSALYPKGSEEKRLLDAMLLAVPR